jgi:2-keto-4-pentenoate hydratase/2-oxohepta-3-ene-1,7-dioic acid hydratase in catechol pathway
MKLVTFTHDGATRVGLVEGTEVTELVAPDMIALLEAGPAAAARVRRLPLDAVRLEAPIRRPPKFLAVGLNYADHVAESGMQTPAHPMIFNKQSTCVVGPTDDVHLPRVSEMVDYEGELGFVIGRRCRHVPAGDAPGVIAGYLVVDDVSARDWQFHTATWTMGKSFDTHGPLGPWIVTPDELPDPHRLEIRTWVNGELRQHSNTRHLIFDCFRLVEYLSAAFTLEVGDIVTTGTPSGIGIGMQPPQLLKAGDVVRVEIESIGRLENRMMPEPDVHEPAEVSA